MADISIIVPVYNVEKYIRRCIDSLISQTFKSIEILLIDDGSTDNSGAICDEYALIDGRIKVVHKRNGGVSSARNVGLDNAAGTYIMFCDPDDYVEPTWCERMYDVMAGTEGDVFFCACGFKRVEANSGKVINIANPVYSNQTVCVPLRDALLFIFEHGLFRSVWSSIFRTEKIQDIDLHFDENLSRNEDTLFILQYLQAVDGKVGFAHEPLYNYSTGIATSLTHKAHANFWEIELNWLNELKKLMCQNGIPYSAYQDKYRDHIIYSSLVSINVSIASHAPKSEIFRRGNAIVHSPECKDAFRYGRFRNVHPLYRAILQTRCFALIWVFNQIVALKRHIAQ